MEQQADYQTGGERLPEPNPEEVAMILEAGRKALKGEVEVRLFLDKHGRLCMEPIQRGKVERP